MKAFAFQLESALLLREREEQTAREAYGRALQALVFAQHQLADAKTLLDELNSTFAERRRRGFKAEEQITYWKAVQQRAGEFERRKEMQAKAAAEVALRRTAMIEARKRYETLVRLKSKRQQAHEAAVRRGEEMMIDDTVVARVRQEQDGGNAMKFLTNGKMIVVLGLVLNLGTMGGLIYAQRSIFFAPSVATAPPVFWGFRTEEVDSMVGELKREREQLDKRDADIDQTAAHIEAERQELEKVKSSIQAMRDEIAHEIPELQETELKNLKSLSQTYAQMKPAAAVAIFREMDDMAVVKILSLMKPDNISGILEEMSHTQDNDQTMAVRAARISDKLRLVKQAKAQPTPAS